MLKTASLKTTSALWYQTFPRVSERVSGAARSGAERRAAERSGVVRSEAERNGAQRSGALRSERVSEREAL